MQAAERHSFHMPGHKAGHGAPPAGVELLGEAAWALDVSELGGFDYLHGPRGALAAAQEDAASAFGAARTFFLVNGATAGNLALVLACVSDGQGLVVARGSHRSVYAGVVLSGATPTYLPPVRDRALDWLVGVELDALERALRLARPAAIHVTSPSFYGLTLPLSSIAELANEHGLPLLVDEAHGSHFAFHPGFPTPALVAGAHAAVQSPHKTLGSLTQSSLLHLGSGPIDAARVDQALQMLQSSSPSALLLASLDAAVEEMVRRGRARLEAVLGLAAQARGAIAAIDGLVLYGDELLGRDGVDGYDPTKLVVDVHELGLTGQAAAAWLRNETRINPEFADLRRLVFSITVGDDASSVEVLLEALDALARARHERTWGAPELVARWPSSVPPLARTPRAGFGGRTEPVPLEHATGRLSAEMIVPYPPGIPLVVPGELLTGDVLAALAQLLGAGCQVVGLADPTASTIACLRD